MSDYTAYLETQRAHSQTRAHWRQSRTWHLMQRLSRLAPTRGRLLCVGCRNRFELDGAQLFGWQATGVDLIQPDRRIVAGDMHQLPFADHTFAAVFGCHVLEHSWDLPAVLQEWQRVSQDGAWWAIELPARFAPSATDRVDVGGLDGLRGHLAPYVQQEAYAHDLGGAVRWIGTVHA